MEEKEIVVGKFSARNKYLIYTILSLAFTVIVTTLYYVLNINGCKIYAYYIPASLFTSSRIVERPVSLTEHFWDVICFGRDELLMASVIFYLGILLFVIFLVIFFKHKGETITVTNLRIYGHSNFGKLIDLPVSSISAVETSGKDTITLKASSGKVSFCNLQNRDEVYKAISNLKMASQ